MKLLVLMVLFSFSFVSVAQIEPKHPRVFEMEEKLESEASKYFSQRFPGEPFFVKVMVQPLRTDVKKGKEAENLPYLEYEGGEDVDEWDDPNTSINQLRNRVKRVQIEVSVSNSLRDTEIQEIKDSLNIYLKLIPYRDEIKVERSLVKKFQVPEIVYYLAPLFFITLLGIGFWLKYSFKSFALNMKQPESVSGNSSGPMMGISASSGSGGDANLTVKNVPPLRGDINFFDPIKLLEVLHLKINQVVAHQNFPTLQDLIIMDRMVEESPGVFGALINEFPLDLQKNIFKLGKSQKWLEAFSYPTQVDQRAFQVLEEMNRSRDMRRTDREWENLLIQLWRLDEKLVPFLKEIPQEHAFIILSQLPKKISLKFGKKVFPGSWAKVLEDSIQNVVIETNSVRDYMKKAITLSPHLDYKSLDAYKKEKEIMDYVRQSSVEDERDIYETLPPGSFVAEARAPFYVVFEQDDKIFKEFVDQFSVQDWALALINSSRQYIKRVSETLDDKKRFVFSVALKNLDENPPSGFDQVEIKERIANRFKAQQMKRINFDKNSVSINEGVQVENKTA